MFDKHRYAKPAPPTAPTRNPAVNCPQPSEVCSISFVSLLSNETFPYIDKHVVRIIIKPTADKNPESRATSVFLSGPNLSNGPTKNIHEPSQSLSLSLVA